MCIQMSVYFFLQLKNKIVYQFYTLYILILDAYRLFISKACCLTLGYLAARGAWWLSQGQCTLSSHRSSSVPTLKIYSHQVKVSYEVNAQPFSLEWLVSNLSPLDAAANRVSGVIHLAWIKSKAILPSTSFQLWYMLFLAK